MAKFRFLSSRYSFSNNPVQTSIHRHPFLLFGLPFIAMVVVGSFALTPVTATRYEHFDKKSRRSERQGAIDSTGVKRRRFDAREEYYVWLME
jgi:cytochrome c oxidase assembly protein subunit 16